MKTYAQIGKEIGELVQEKNTAYGSAFKQSAEILKLLYPKGISPEQMTDALLLVRISDKMFRIANKKDAFGESPYGDIAGYGILGVEKDQKDQKDENPLYGVGTPLSEVDSKTAKDRIVSGTLKSGYVEKSETCRICHEEIRNLMDHGEACLEKLREKKQAEDHFRFNHLMVK